MEHDTRSRIALIRTADRASGIPRAIDLFGFDAAAGKRVLLKPNFNTADPFPASTHNDTLRALIRKLKAIGAAEVTVGERSGPVDTADVLRDKGIHRLCEEEGAGLMNFEDLPEDGWAHVRPEGSHWRNGFRFARPVLEAQCVVTTCCLKTHGFGGGITMSLKLSVGMVHKANMTELHTSLLSMKKMIAEVNTAYSPALVVMDAIEAFTDRGPMSGPRARADVILAGADRVAMDAVGVAILKDLGSNRAVMSTPVFAQPQIARAVELGLGASGPEDIEIVTGDDLGEAYAARLRSILAGR